MGVRGRFSLLDSFLQNEKILFLAEVIALSNLKITYNYTTRANFKRDLKIYLLLILSGYVLGTILKVCSWQNFDLGLKTEIIGF